MEVAAGEVDKFLSTLKEYSDKCETNRNAMEQAMKEGQRRLAEHEKACAGYARTIESTLKNMEDMYKKQCVEIKGVKSDREVMEKLVSKASECCREGRRIIGRMDIKENFLCSFVDIVKQSETMTRFQYTRFVYAGTMCKEIAKGAWQLWRLL